MSLTLKVVALVAVAYVEPAFTPPRILKEAGVVDALAAFAHELPSRRIRLLFPGSHDLAELGLELGHSLLTSGLCFYLTCDVSGPATVRDW